MEFTTVLKKEEILSSVKRFNKGKKSDEKLNTTHLKIKGTKKPIYASELLTAKVKVLFYLSRDFAKTHDYSYCWTSNGVVYLRKRDGAPLLRVDQQSDLDKLRQPI